MRLLLAEDDSGDLSLIESLFQVEGFEILKTHSREETLAAVQSQNVDLVLLAVIKSTYVGFETAKGIKKLKDIPIIFLTNLVNSRLVIEGLENGVDEFVTQPFMAKEIFLRVKNLLKMKEHENIVRTVAEHRTQRLKHTFQKWAEANREVIHRLLLASEFRDDETGQHIFRVGSYSRLIAKNLGFGKRFVESIEEAGQIHDIGKIGIPDRILLKPGKLTLDEFEVVKTHTLIGASILERGTSYMMKMAYEIALSHHEKWDGSGYPFGTHKKDIPISARIVAVVDVFDALTSKRPYKEPFTWEKSVDIIVEEKGKHFDPDVVDAFFEGINEERKIYDYANRGRDLNQTA